MAELCVHLVPLFNALPTNDQMQIEELVHHQNYQKSELVMDPTSSNNLVIVAHGGTRLYTLDENGRENVTQISKRVIMLVTTGYLVKQISILMLKLQKIVRFVCLIEMNF
mgnify:CR=1 FL=1